MSSFSEEEVTHFKQIFSQFSDEIAGGVTRENFFPAMEACLGFVGNRPSPDYLLNEFQRLTGEAGVIQWQPFFQILLHLKMEPPATAPPPPPSYDQILQEDQAPESHHLESRRPSNTVGRRLLRNVGNFFGVTQESQLGGDGQLGWAEYNERNFEENAGIFSTLTRRHSIRRQHANSVPPPPAVAYGQSFNLNELADDSDNEDEFGLTTAPPPGYDETTMLGVQGAGGRIVEQHSEPLHPVQRPEIVPSPSEGGVHRDLLYNKEEAWDYYVKYVKEEKRLRRRRHQSDAYEFFGGAGGSLPSGVHGRTGSIRRDRIATDEGRVRRPTKLQRQSTMVRTEVESLPSFWPVFICLLSFTQVIAMIILLVIYGLAPIRLYPIEKQEEYPSLSSMNSSLLEEVTYYRGSNLWIGPTPLHLINLGAKFTPCMRKDFGIRLRNARTFRENKNFGCCQNEHWIGTVEIEDCVVQTRENASRFFIGGETCSNVSGFVLGSSRSFHPCCISITGGCQVMHESECTARGGFFHSDIESCEEVNCFRDICGFGEVLVGEETRIDGSGPDPLSPYAQQFWRFFSSLLVHLGIIHIVLIIPLQLYVGIKIERTIGWLRTLIIYTLSGVGGNLVSAVFIPYGVNAGASGAVFGMLGVLYVELFQFWQIVDHAWFELLKLSSFCLFLLLLGTLPYVDNMAHIGGILFGVPTAIVFVPYITFGKWDAVRKRILLLICLPLLFAMFVVGFLTFYLIPDPSFCSFCHYINCIPYTSELCRDEFSNLNAEVFSL